jgi:3-oxocholest-4-en-26-oyl-CoA dehydrogenase beta subunit
MDFTFSDDQQSVRSLAAQVFGGHASTERVRAVEAGDERVDRELWAQLAATGLLGVAVPEAAGGAGLGIVEACLVLEQQGAHVAPVPLWQTVTAALAIAESGTGPQQAAVLPHVCDGTLMLTVALEEFGAAALTAPATRASRNGDGDWLLTGTKAAVPAAHVASRALVSASLPDGAPAVFLVDLHAAGITAEPADTTAHEPAAHLSFADAPAELLGGADALGRVLDLAQVAIAAVQLGVAGSAMRQGATYVSEREQFGRPIGTFQAVQHQLADCYLDVEAMRVTLWQAAWVLDAGGQAGTSVGVASWWAADGGARVVHRVQHLHGGIGVDVDYPIHRYLLWGKQLAGLLGGQAARLERLGERIAS